MKVPAGPPEALTWEAVISLARPTSPIFATPSLPTKMFEAFKSLSRTKFRVKDRLRVGIRVRVTVGVGVGVEWGLESR